MNKVIANMTIDPAVNRRSLKKKDYRTGDIIELVQEVIKTDSNDTRRFAEYFSPDRRGLKQLFDFVYNNFEYSEDPNFNQWVQTPSYLWESKKGDCKSFTVFISSVLQNMGIAHIIRYVSYGLGPVTHVYPVALLKGKEIPLDVVYRVQKGGHFGTEKNYFKKKDFHMKGLYKLGTTTTAPVSQKQIQKSIQNLEAAFADVPDSIIHTGPGDVTTMTSGQLDRIIWEDRYNIWADQESDHYKSQAYRDAAIAMKKGSIAGIGSLQNDEFGRQVNELLLKTGFDTKPAFGRFTLEIPTPGISGGLKSFFKKIGNAFKKVFKKFVNWIFKGVGKAMAPYFIFLFADRSKVKSGEVKRRMTEQKKTFDWIADTGKLEKSKLLGVVLNGIKEKTSQTPQDILNGAAGRKIAGFAAVIGFVSKAIGFVVKVISKIRSLFKTNSDAGEVGEGNMSDPSLLDGEDKKKESSGEGSSDSGSGGLIKAAAFAAAIMSFI